jgi:hypothetical protein
MFFLQLRFLSTRNIGKSDINRPPPHLFPSLTEYNAQRENPPLTLNSPLILLSFWLVSLTYYIRSPFLRSHPSTLFTSLSLNTGAESALLPFVREGEEVVFYGGSVERWRSVAEEEVGEEGSTERGDDHDEGT